MSNPVSQKSLMTTKQVSPLLTILSARHLMLINEVCGLLSNTGATILKPYSYVGVKLSKTLSIKQ